MTVLDSAFLTCSDHSPPFKPRARPASKLFNTEKESKGECSECTRQ